MKTYKELPDVAKGAFAEECRQMTTDENMYRKGVITVEELYSKAESHYNTIQLMMNQTLSLTNEQLNHLDSLSALMNKTINNFKRGLITQTEVDSAVEDIKAEILEIFN